MTSGDGGGGVFVRACVCVFRSFLCNKLRTFAAIKELISVFFADSIRFFKTLYGNETQCQRGPRLTVTVGTKLRPIQKQTHKKPTANTCNWIQNPREITFLAIKFDTANYFGVGKSLTIPVQSIPEGKITIWLESNAYHNNKKGIYRWFGKSKGY